MSYKAKTKLPTLEELRADLDARRPYAVAVKNASCIMHQDKKKGMTAWVRKALIEHAKGKRVVMVYPIDKWVLMLLKAILGDHASVRNLGDVRWLAIEDGSQGKGTGRHIACFILEPK